MFFQCFSYILLNASSLLNQNRTLDNVEDRKTIENIAPDTSSEGHSNISLQETSEDEISSSTPTTLKEAVLSIYQLLTPKSIAIDSQEITYVNQDLPSIPPPKKKKNYFSLFGDLLYFKAIEDSVHYAEHIPQNPTFQPKVQSINQNFDYELGFRVGVSYAFREKWNIVGTWMRYFAQPESRHASSSDFGLLATFATPVWGSLGNSEVNKVKGSWNLLINAIDLDIRRLFKIKEFSVTPVIGIKAGLIDQNIHIRYGEFLIEFPAQVSPRTVKGKSSFWGVGPLLGVELGYHFSKKFHMFATGSFSCLTGNFETTTNYTDFSTPVISTPENTVVKVNNSETLVSLVEQLQMGFNKTWKFKMWSIDTAIGWEVQVWQKQMKLNSFSTFVTPPDSADLSLYGPFLKIEIKF